jgi:uncharacterized protein (DUF2236 family)
MTPSLPGPQIPIPRIPIPRLSPPSVPSAVSSAAADSVPGRLVQQARELIAAGFRNLLSGESDGQPDWVRQLADGTDEGYFGPGSATWAVHGSLPTLVGGVRALLLQTLHPAALAGVMQHSRYEEDALGRLVGTTRWLTVTTFGDTVMADRECARVRGMHKKVRGTYEEHGATAVYSASDPDLLRWVHVAFTDSFLSAHRVWGGQIPGGEDQYVAEWAKAGELVGLEDPPRSAGELAEQLASFDNILTGGEGTAKTVSFIRNPPLPIPARPPYSALFAGAVASLPPHYRSMLGVPTVPMTIAKPAVGSMLGALALVLGPQSPSMRNAQERADGLGDPIEAASQEF